MPHPTLRAPALAAALVLLAATLAPAQTPPAARDTVPVSLGEALAVGLQRSPLLHQAAAERSATGAGLWDAYGNLLPQVGIQGQAQRSQEGRFAFLGTEFLSPRTYTTAYQWDFVHSLLDSGRDWFRIKSARADVDRAIARYDDTALENASEIKTQYLNAKRHEATATLAERELERRQQHLRLAEARHEVGAVTRSDVLQARIEVSEEEVAILTARTDAEEARLALRRLLGGALPPGPLELTTDFVVFRPEFDEDELVTLALDGHPELREARAAQRVGEAELWIARSTYLPSLQFQYTLSRSAVDTSGFEFSEFNDRDFWVVSLNWPLFGRFERHGQTSRASANLQTAREEERLRTLVIDETVRVAHARLVTAHAAHTRFVESVELAREDLRLAEGRYETGVGTFLDLLDARVRAEEAENRVLSSTYDFYLALVALERATGLSLFPEGAVE